MSWHQIHELLSYPWRPDRLWPQAECDACISAHALAMSTLPGENRQDESPQYQTIYTTSTTAHQANYNTHSIEITAQCCTTGATANQAIHLQFEIRNPALSPM